MRRGAEKRRGGHTNRWTALLLILLLQPSPGLPNSTDMCLLGVVLATQTLDL